MPSWLQGVHKVLCGASDALAFSQQLAQDSGRASAARKKGRLWHNGTDLRLRDQAAQYSVRVLASQEYASKLVSCMKCSAKYRLRIELSFVVDDAGGSSYHLDILVF